MVKPVRQVTARFSAPMVAFGDPRLPDQFEIVCAQPGIGRWADQQNWVYDFRGDLPAGVACSFTLKPQLKSLAGEALTGEAMFRFDTGGPAIAGPLSRQGAQKIDAEQHVFFLPPDAPAKP